MKVAFGAAAIAMTAGACLSFGDLSGGSDAGNPVDGSIPDDAVTQNIDGAVSDGASVMDSGDADVGSDGSCTGTAGPSMLRVGTGPSSYCVDATEVTYGQYETFVAAIAADTTTPVQPAACAFNTSFQPSAMHSDSSDPVTNIDWCDAYAFCAYAGKRLCGKIGGGSLEPINAGNPAFAQWTRACSISPDGGTRNYPYANSPDNTSCNGSERDAGQVIKVGSLPRCMGGPAGVFDMSGNVDEWEDCCIGTDGGADCCDSRGGGFNDYETSCGIGDVLTTACPGRTRNQEHSDLGFRCCSQ